jgi:two-component system KDP operon response regulator KdpE
VSARILVVDDELQMRRVLTAGLEYHGYDVTATASGSEALTEAVAWRPDVVLVDLGLPDTDGFELISRLREKTRAALIVVSVMPGERDKVRALDLGADDYVVKPFGIDELEARIRAVLRRQAALAQTDTVLRRGALEINLATRDVTVEGREVKLTPTEYELLRYLAVHAGKPITHSTLLREVWGDYAVGETYNTRYVVAQIRRKLQDDPSNPRFIRTEPGVGYRLQA